MFSDEFTCLLLYLSWNVLICNLHLKNMIHPKDSSPMMRFSNSHFCVQMVTVIKNENFLKKKSVVVAFCCSTMKPLGIFGMTLEKYNHSSLLSSSFSPFFFLMLKNSRTSTWIGFKKNFSVKTEKKSCRLFDPENLTILYGNKTLQNFSQFDTVVDTLEELFCAYQVAMIEQKRNAHFFFFSFGKPQLTGENGGKLNFSR